MAILSIFTHKSALLPMWMLWQVCWFSNLSWRVHSALLLGMRALASLPSGGYSEAFGVNSLGQVVGQSGSSLGTRAVLWSGGSVTDLNDLVTDLPPGTILTGAFSINDQGQIVAFGVSNPNLNKNQQARMDDHLHSGPTHVYMLTPQSASTVP
jgi:probable HAF family extracellular repeat protein